MSEITSLQTGSEARREFLNLLPSPFRSKAANLFLDPIRAKLRAGETCSPGEVAHAVRSEVARRLKTWRLNADQKVGLEAMREALSLDCAHDYATYLIRLEGLPADECKTVKKQRDAASVHHIQPTLKQLNFLRLLHYKGETPATLGEAVVLIDRLKKGESR